ncbi:hypothetical protein V8F06_011648 [Rhypophila decipiens]
MRLITWSTGCAVCMGTCMAGREIWRSHDFRSDSPASVFPTTEMGPESGIHNGLIPDRDPSTGFGCYSDWKLALNLQQDQVKCSSKRKSEE